MGIKMVCISDTHCQLGKMDIPEGDILVHAGDALSHGTRRELSNFLYQYEKLPHAYKIYVPGNHDRITEENEQLVKDECASRNIIYLNDSGINILGYNFWGSAITPRFHDWAWNRDSMNCGTSVPKDHPKYKSIKPHWDMIPENTDVLVTHGPPKGIMDMSIYNGVHCGCPHLLNKVQEIKPKYHIFGHIHNWHGINVGETTFVNASSCTEQYNPVNPPIELELE